MDCEICRGRGHIELPIWRRPLVTSGAFDTFPSAVEPMSKTFPCPECGGQVGYSRLAIVREETFVHERYVDEGRIVDVMHADMAARLGQKLLSEGLIRLERKPSSSSAYPLSEHFRATVGVVAPDKVAEFEDRVNAGQHEMAAAVAEEAKRLIKSERGVGPETIWKDDAGSLVSAALLKVAADRAAWRKYQNASTREVVA